MYQWVCTMYLKSRFIVILIQELFFYLPSTYGATRTNKYKQEKGQLSYT